MAVHVYMLTTKKRLSERENARQIIAFLFFGKIKLKSLYDLLLVCRIAM